MMNNINLQIDAAARQVSQNGKAVYLTQTEFDLLLYLLDNAGRITTRSELLAQVWGITAPIHTRTVDMHIAKLRHKLGKGLCRLAGGVVLRLILRIAQNERLFLLRRSRLCRAACDCQCRCCRQQMQQLTAGHSRASRAAFAASFRYWVGVMPVRFLKARAK